MARGVVSDMVKRICIPILAAMMLMACAEQVVDIPAALDTPEQAAPPAPLAADQQPEGAAHNQQGQPRPTPTVQPHIATVVRAAPTVQPLRPSARPAPKAQAAAVVARSDLPGQGNSATSTQPTLPPAELTGPTSTQFRLNILHVGYRGPKSMEELILTADVIARVSLVCKRTYVEQIGHAEDPRWGVDLWSPMLEFRFRVHEYLKGSGPNEIGGVVYRIEHNGAFWDTRETALAGAANMAAAHDSRRESREAIVFLWSEDRVDDDIQLTTGQYWFGEMAFITDNYSEASIHKKAWLPEAIQSGGSSTRSASEQLFLLDAPASTSTRAGRIADSLTAPFRTARAPASGSSAPTISLSAMKAKVAALETRTETPILPTTSFS